jgi:hypothetical protein
MSLPHRPHVAAPEIGCALLILNIVFTWAALAPEKHQRGRAKFERRGFSYIPFALAQENKGARHGARPSKISLLDEPRKAGRPQPREPLTVSAGVR